MNINIPGNVSQVTKLLTSMDFEAFLVGGCVRDSFTGNIPKDWDIATNALPDQVVELFEKEGFRVVAENQFGTVKIVFEDEDIESTVREVEVTTYRTDGIYLDNRHPEAVHFVKSIEEDLARRDFTVNAMAFDPTSNTVVDPFNGQKDIEDKILRAVGDAETRFTEDALRMMRLVRFAAQLGFMCNSDTLAAANKLAPNLANVSRERIRDEFVKIINSDQPALGMMLLVKLNMMQYVAPEFLEGVDCEQKGEHVYDVINHLFHALQHAAEKGFPFYVRLAALFHDIGKPRTRRWDGSKAGGAGKYTFYGHEVVGAKMTKKILENLKFSRETVDRVTKFVRWHMFFSDTEQISLSAVRRMVANVGSDDIWDLMKVRECDRVGMKKKEAPYRLRKYFAMIEEVLHDPIDVKMLKINGEVMINELHMKPGPEMGWILHALLEEVLDDPSKNTKEFLVKRTNELAQLSRETLKEMGEKGRKIKDEEESKLVEELHVKHGVKV